MHSSPPERTPKSQLAAEQPSTGECWIPPKKKIPHVQRQRSPNKTVGGAKSCFQSNCKPARDTWRVKQNLVHTRTQRPQRDGTKSAFDCLSVSCWGMGQQWPATETEALAAADPEHAACSISPLRGGHD